MNEEQENYGDVAASLAQTGKEVLTNPLDRILFTGRVLIEDHMVNQKIGLDDRTPVHSGHVAPELTLLGTLVVAIGDPLIQTLGTFAKQRRGAPRDQVENVLRLHRTINELNWAKRFKRSPIVTIDAEGWLSEE